MLRGVRGAIQVSANERSAILRAAEELMLALIENNRISQENVSAVFFTVTKDLDACFPASVRAQIGWDLVPFLCGQEIPVPGLLDRLLRVLILFDTELSPAEVKHQYLGAAAALRPDLQR